MIDPWWAGLAAVVVPVDCLGQSHRLRWARGQLTAVDHPDAQRDRPTGDGFSCPDLLHTWAAHADDLQVLVLTSRGPHDRRPGWEPTTTRFVRRTVEVIGSPGGRRRDGGHPDSGLPSDLLDLMEVSHPLAERLAATVAANWARRLAEDPAEVAAALPALQAALYGRAAADVRDWLDEPGLAVTVRMLDNAGAEALTRSADGVTLDLTFDWLTDLWFRRMTTVWGRFCLAANATSDGYWALTTAAAEGGRQEVAVISAPRGEETAP